MALGAMVAFVRDDDAAVFHFYETIMAVRCTFPASNATCGFMEDVFQELYKDRIFFD